MTELALLQTVRLKGRVARAELTGPVDDAVAAGLLVDAPMVRLTDPGRTRLTELLAEERAGVDRDAANRVYERFLVVNAGVKPLISQWQLTRDAAGPDEVAAVLDRLDELHRQVLPVITAASELVARLDGYAERLGAALRRARDGDMSWLTRPMVDSYHTVWFELHEELIGLAGRTRATEAESGSGG
ncbi:MarR family transcriptional regulator [Mycolicibacterium sp. P1-18]|uniref:MarR family transcriptional regulator n=1 Tax=Mycolicibacterium sp. P1-18 TaxID=2024615 RepID=UPI0011F0F260|nr:MarR family transcriptional regulator [Mycolicibacterium sp. P1-18]KAA0099850.1 MarR family transcriptional regulator [Mycolicibacterium sp. P1-18]